MSRGRANEGRRRPGGSLVELAIALAVSATLIAVLGGLARASRVASRGAATDALRQDLADAGELLVRDLRDGLSPSAQGDTALELSRAIGGAMSCSASGRFALRREHAWWLLAPEPGDSAWWYDGTGWRAAAVRAVGTARCDDGQQADVLHLPSGWADGAVVPVRVLRRVRWVAYRDGAGRWSLGSRQRTATWSAVQPVVGPFDELRLGAAAGAAWRLRLTARRGGATAEVERSVARRNGDPGP